MKPGEIEGFNSTFNPSLKTLVVPTYKQKGGDASFSFYPNADLQ